MVTGSDTCKRWVNESGDDLFPAGRYRICRARGTAT